MEVALVVTIGRHRDGGVVVVDVLAGEEARPVRQTMSFFGEAFLHCLKRRNRAANRVANEAVTTTRNKKVT